jgi:hypothetical protein
MAKVMSSLVVGVVCHRDGTRAGGLRAAKADAVSRWNMCSPTPTRGEIMLSSLAAP